MFVSRDFFLKEMSQDSLEGEECAVFAIDFYGHLAPEKTVKDLQRGGRR